MSMKRAFKALLLFTLMSLFLLPAAMANPKAVYTVDDAKYTASNAVYEYHPGSIYNVHVSLTRVTDIALPAGENFAKAVAGDTKQWLIDTAKVGNVSHVYIKPLANNVSTNMVINTDKRSYHLLITAKGTYNPLVTFTIPEQKEKVSRAISLKKTPESEFMDIYTEKDMYGDIVVKPMNYNYKMKSNKGMDEELCPKKVFDDGIRTYIEMPKNRYDLPVLYNVDPTDKKKLTLVNYRIKGKYYVADRVFNHARLQYTSKLYVDIFPVKEGEKK